MGFRDARRAREDVDAIGRDHNHVANVTRSSPPRGDDSGTCDGALPSPFHSNQPTIPLCHLPCYLALCWLIKRVLLRRLSTYRNRTLLVRSGSGRQFELSQEELATHIQSLKARKGSNSKGDASVSVDGDGGGSLNDHHGCGDGNEVDVGGGGIGRGGEDGGNHQSAGNGGNEINQSHSNAIVNLGRQISKLEEDSARQEATLLAALDAKAILCNEATQRTVELQEQLSKAQNENSELSKRIGWLEERSKGLEEENALLDKEMERLVDEMGEMCKEDQEINGHEGEELEFGEGVCGSSLLQESLTDDSDDDGDDSSWDDSEEGGTELQVTELQSKNQELQLELNTARATIANISSELSSVKGENGKLQERLDYQNSNKERTSLNGDLTPSITEVSLGSLYSSSFSGTVADVKGELDAAIQSKTRLVEELTSLQSTDADVTNKLGKKEAELEEARSLLAAMKEDAPSATMLLSEKINKLHNAKTFAEKQVAALKDDLNAEQLTKAATENVLKAAIVSNRQLTDQVADLRKIVEEERKQFHEKEAVLEEPRSSVSVMEDNKIEERVAALERELESEQLVAAAEIAELRGKLDAAILSNTQLAEEVSCAQNAKDATAKVLLEVLSGKEGVASI